jgi:hypothetical protein
MGTRVELDLTRAPFLSGPKNAGNRAPPVNPAALWQRFQLVSRRRRRIGLGGISIEPSHCGVEDRLFG